MTLPAGTRLGVYEIVGPLGAGGMGEVYRARDTRLNRQVAVKVLSGVFAGDPERVSRIEREAQILASLNHANIAHIHGVEESSAGPALVMELVEGEELAARIGRGALPQVEAFAIATQIAEALAAAHDRGIVHRDLKPANIKVGANGAVKVLDFGLAKALDPVGESPIDRADAPTLTSAGTRIGTVLGTAAYMAPEQARGVPIDKRADIWAFGCVFFEMLTGRSAFPGQTITETIAAVLEREPDWRLLPGNLPAGIRRLLRRCLEKDPRRRLHDIADARLEIDDARDGTDASPAAVPVRSRPWPAWAWALMIVVPVAAAAAGWMLRPVPQVPEARLDITTPPSADPSLAISPDGRTVVFAAGSGTQAQLWVRSLGAPLARPLAGTQHGTRPFWSPDSRSIGFFADAKLKRVDIDGGSPLTLSSAVAVPLGGTWNREGTILFSNSPGGSILRISERGGPATPATSLDRGSHRGHYFPEFLPDGRHFLFFVSSGQPEVHGVYVGALDRSQTTRLFDAGPVVYATTGHLWFVRGSKIFAQGFDADRQTLEGDPFIVEEQVIGDTRLAASAAGPIAYRTGSADAGQRQLAWIDRAGRELEKVVYDDTAAQGPSLSHDGRRIAVYRFANGNMDLWSYDIKRRAWERLTFDPGDDIYPLWSPGDTSIVFGAVRKTANLGIYRRIVGAPPGSEEELLVDAPGAFPMDWSADGRFLLYASASPAQGVDLWALPLDAPRKPFEVVRTEFNETMAQFSPNGSWIAYQSDKTGRDEIYLRPFPGPGPDSPVSIDGGAQVRWNANGRELFYVAADDRLMAVPITTAADGKTVEPGAPSPLFTTRVGSTATLKYRQQYVVSGDGQSFVMNSLVAEPSTSPITVILNWKPRR
jgi:Tol biopolymer transport system component